MPEDDRARAARRCAALGRLSVGVVAADEADDERQAAVAASSARTKPFLARSNGSWSALRSLTARPLAMP